ncbi:hypothetical protein ACA910_022540 [Epithemia clementina (nom. ined.)]
MMVVGFPIAPTRLVARSQHHHHQQQRRSSVVVLYPDHAKWMGNAKRRRPTTTRTLTTTLFLSAATPTKTSQTTTTKLLSSSSSSSLVRPGTTVTLAKNNKSTNLITRIGTDQDRELLRHWLEQSRAFHATYNNNDQTTTGQLHFKQGKCAGLQALLPELPHARVLFLLRPEEHHYYDDEEEEEKGSSSAPNDHDDDGKNEASTSHRPPAPPPTTVIGFGTYNIQYSGLDTPPSLFLQDIFVDESHRGSGAGQFMMHQLLDAAQSLGCSHMTWNTDRRNTKASDFYTRCWGAECITGTTGEHWLHMKIPVRPTANTQH